MNIWVQQNSSSKRKNKKINDYHHMLRKSLTALRKSTTQWTQSHNKTNIDSVSIRHVFTTQVRRIGMQHAVSLYNKHYEQLKSSKHKYQMLRDHKAFYLSLWSEQLSWKFYIQFLALQDTPI